MIRKSELKDLDTIMNIWICENLAAHDFIQSGYWDSHYDEVKEAIRTADIYVFEDDEIIKGFLGLIGQYIAGLFISQKYQSQGIGSALLKYVQEKNKELTLSVYEANEKAVKFYEKHSFKLQKKLLDEETNQIEYLMEWKR